MYIVGTQLNWYLECVRFCWNFQVRICLVYRWSVKVHQQYIICTLPGFNLYLPQLDLQLQLKVGYLYNEILIIVFKCNNGVASPLWKMTQLLISHYYYNYNITINGRWDPVLKLFWIGVSSTTKAYPNYSEHLNCAVPCFRLGSVAILHVMCDILQKTFQYRDIHKQYILNSPILNDYNPKDARQWRGWTVTTKTNYNLNKKPSCWAAVRSTCSKWLPLHIPFFVYDCPRLANSSAIATDQNPGDTSKCYEFSQKCWRPQ